MRKKVYICLPDTAEKSVLEKAALYTKYVLRCGAAPVVPHLLVPYMLDIDDKDIVIFELGQSLLWFCDEMWVFEDMSDFPGASEKITFCKSLNIPIVRINNKKIIQ